MVDTTKLIELKTLLDSGALTQEEFDAEKKKLLDAPVLTQVAVTPMPASAPGEMVIVVNKPQADSRLGLEMGNVGPNVVIVRRIDPDSISAASALEVNDVIKTINGEAVTGHEKAVEKIKAAPAGAIQFAISRVPPATTSGIVEMAIVVNKPEADSRLGLKMGNVGPNVVIVSRIDPDSISAASALEVNDVIQTVNGEAVTGHKEAVAKIKAAPAGAIQLTISRMQRAPELPPPGCPPGGEWVDEKYCGCMSLMVCVVCGCLSLICGPYDERRVYKLPNGNRYNANGSMIPNP